MAELLAAGAGLGIASSLITFAEVGWKVVRRIKEYNDRTDDVPEVLKHINAQLPVLLNKVAEIQRQIDGKSQQCIRSESALAVAVTSCEEQIKRLDVLTGKMLPSGSDSKTRRAKKVVYSIYYEKELNKTWAEMETYKTTLVLHFTPTTEVTARMEALELQRSVFSVPFERDLKFISRGDVMTQIESTLRDHHRVAIAGIGGIGKSQIAIEYCYRYSDTYSDANVFWIHAATRERFLQAYQHIARKLLIPGWDSPTVNTLQIVREWFMDVRNGRWLLVLDNADDMNMFYPIDTSTVQEGGEEVYLINYLPSNSKGSILITTKDTTAGRSLANGREPIVIRPMTPDEGKDMLLSRAPSIQSDNCVEKLLTELEYIPLAISQAAAFIRENNIKASQYLKLIHDNEASILDRGFYDWRRDPETPNSVTRTWSLSFDLIRKRNSYAIHLLSLMSVLDRQGIPRTLFDSEGVDEADLIIAFGTLQAFSLISVDKVGATFEMHRLVELSTRKWLDHQSALVHWQEKALSLLAGKFPIGHYESWVACEALISHAQIVLTYDFETRDSRLDYASLLRTVAAFDWRQGRYGPAEDKLRRALDEREKTLGQDHQDTLTTSHELANVLSDLGKFENAEVIYRRLLKEYEEAHGENHHWTLRLVNNLGLLFRDQGKYEQAEEMLWRALKGNENTLGKNHRSTLASVDNLAIVFADQGKYEQAEEMQLRAMKGRENMLGKDHPLMLNSVANLAVMFRKQGKYEQAEKLNWRALKGKEKTLGKDHRETLISVANLACLFADQGKYEEAEEMNWRALNEREKVLGKNHPDTLMSVSNLAVLFDKQGKYEQAGEMYQLALDKREKILGKDHPDTLHSAYRLGRFYDLYNKYNEASSLLQRACEGLQNRLGAEHPKTLACQQYCAERIRRREQQTHGESNVS